MILDELSIGVCVGCFFLFLWIAQEAVSIWLDSRRSKPQLTPEDLARCQTWLDMKAQPRIPPGTPTHKFDDIPDDDLLANREGHPYT